MNIMDGWGEDTRLVGVEVVAVDVAESVRE